MQSEHHSGFHVVGPANGASWHMRDCLVTIRTIAGSEPNGLFLWCSRGLVAGRWKNILVPIRATAPIGRKALAGLLHERHLGAHEEARLVLVSDPGDHPI